MKIIIHSKKEDLLENDDYQVKPNCVGLNLAVSFSETVAQILFKVCSNVTIF